MRDKTSAKTANVVIEIPDTLLIERRHHEKLRNKQRIIC